MQRQESESYEDYELEYAQQFLQRGGSSTFNYFNQEKQQIGVKFLQQEEIFESLNKLILETQEMIPNYNFDSLIEILHYYLWNKDKLIEAYFKSDKEQEKLTKLFIEKGFIKKPVIIQTKEEFYCQICVTNASIENPLIKVQCGHEFCKQCWIEHAREKLIVEKDPFIICMQNSCRMTLPYSAITLMFQEDEKFMTDYRKSICKRYIEENPNMAWCPGVDCKYCVQADQFSKDIFCQCGFEFCFKCRDEVHPPTPCDMVYRWMLEVKKDEANIRWIMVNTKMCPFCKKNVERSEGCNFMSCKPPGGCGNSFCYVCSKPWAPYHNDHYKCSVYKPSEENLHSQNKEKEILMKYNFFYERFVNSEGAKKKSIERKEKLPEAINQIFKHIQVTYQESQFLEDAVKELINSRSVLKWFYEIIQIIFTRSYCFGYFISGSDKKSSDLFIHYQSQFEVVCEKLAICLINLFDFIEKFETEDNKKNINEQFQEFSKYKQEIQSHVAICKKFKQNLIENINSGEIFIQS